MLLTCSISHFPDKPSFSKKIWQKKKDLFFIVPEGSSSSYRQQWIVFLCADQLFEVLNMDFACTHHKLIAQHPEVRTLFWF